MLRQRLLRGSFRRSFIARGLRLRGVVSRGRSRDISFSGSLRLNVSLRGSFGRSLFVHGMVMTLRSGKRRSRSETGGGGKDKKLLHYHSPT